MAILEAVHYFMTITIFTISSLILYLQFTTAKISSCQVVCRSTLLLTCEVVN